MKIKDVINGFAEFFRSAKNKLVQWLLLQKIICEVVFSREKPRNKKRKMPGKGTASTKEKETHLVLPSSSHVPSEEEHMADNVIWKTCDRTKISSES